MWGHMNSYGWGSMGLGMIGVLLFWVAVKSIRPSLTRKSLIWEADNMY